MCLIFVVDGRIALHQASQAAHEAERASLSDKLGEAESERAARTEEAEAAEVRAERAEAETERLQCEVADLLSALRVWTLTCRAPSCRKHMDTCVTSAYHLSLSKKGHHGSEN
jgi:hypothetical protein